MKEHDLAVKEWTDAEQWLANEVIQGVIGKASGQLDSECIGNYPRDVYFIGNLRPEPVGDDDLARPRNSELVNKLSPVAFGIDVKIAVNAGTSVEADTELSWAVYYRVFPKYDQQKSYQESPSRNAKDLYDECEDEGNERPTTHGSDKDAFLLRFKKIECRATGHIVIDRREKDKPVVRCEDFQKAVEAELLRAKEHALSDPEIFRSKANDSETRIRIPIDALRSEESYQEFCAALDQPVEPRWAWQIRVGIHSSLDGPDVFLLTLDFVNSTPGSDRAENRENYLFGGKAKVTFQCGCLVPFELCLAPKGFRENRSMLGKGRNCAIVDSDLCTIETTHVPVYKQRRLQTRETPAARFDDLANDPIPVLQEILGAMEQYRENWKRAHDTYRSQSSWTEESEAEFQADWERYEDEIKRFAAGLNLLRENNDLRYAFQLTNRVFARCGRKAWRLFQIVFLVSQLPGIAASDPNDPEREMVDIIYFPTGGGKTEAYLGVVILNCFWDRLNGKTAGVTAWLRFPLRLLTVQQMQRVADVVGMAELVRREQADKRLCGEGVDGFAAGYFVGEGGTPNEIIPPSAQNRSPNANWSIATDEDARQKRWKTIARCPACKTATIRVDFMEDEVRLLHRCTQPKCPFPDGILPVYIVDNEIFRYLPSVVVGTIDKLASLGLQRKLSLMLGKVEGRCPKHGYYSYKCCQKGCTEKNLPRRRPPGISGPTLFVQDELHLLREGLGTFDSHYETLIQRLLRTAGTKATLKIIASSATIEAFDRQVEHLYGRRRDQARVFPGPGPLKEQSFYAASLEYPQRIYVGVLPHNKTLFNAALEMLEYYHRSLQDIDSGLKTGSCSVPSNVDPGEIVDLYRTSLVYFLASRELHAFRTDVENNVNEDLLRDSYNALRIAELTGATPTDDVTVTLDRLQQPRAATDNFDTVLATSMVSHGVDVDRLNVMLFHGMPRQNSEYVQASSRVGRSHLGIVFTCLHPARERDQSHYAYFAKYHEFLGQLIEPVSINRWSKFSVDRTLPGLFMAVLLQELAGRASGKNPDTFYMFDAVKRMIAEREVTINDFLPAIVEAYQLDTNTGPGPSDFRARIEEQLNRMIYDQIGTNSASHTFVSEALIPRPMRSLREVDEQIEVNLDRAGSDWARAREGGR